MADTGAPWNIPYVEPTDLVREYPAADEAQANAIAAGLTAAGNAGIGSNVVSVTKTDHFSTASATYVDITDLSVTITPSAASSKVLVVAQFAAGHSTNTGGLVTGRVLRDATPISVGTVGTGNTFGWLGNFFSAGFITSVTLDSPATAAATVYKMQLQAVTGTSFINRSGNSPGASFSSSITVIEVAA